MRVNIAATKTNLIRMKRGLSVTQEGYELLDEKRKILMVELASVIEDADKAQREADEMLKKAYEALEKAIVAMGRKKIEELSLSMDIQADLDISHRQVMGVSLPVIKVKVTENPPFYSPVGLHIMLDEAKARFAELLTLLASLAEERIALQRLAKEIQKTIRKVNALEKIHLPFYRDAVKYIGDRLDEETRDAFSMLKMIKGRLQK
jgi:V/A-type H+-transporting ATPase subunit D